MGLLTKYVADHEHHKRNAIVCNYPPDQARDRTKFITMCKTVTDVGYKITKFCLGKKTGNAVGIVPYWLDLTLIVKRHASCQ